MSFPSSLLFPHFFLLLFFVVVLATRYTGRCYAFCSFRDNSKWFAPNQRRRHFQVMLRCMVQLEQDGVCTKEQKLLTQRMLDFRRQSQGDREYKMRDTIDTLRREIRPVLPPASLLVPEALVFNESGEPAHFITRWHGSTLDHYLKTGKQEWRHASLLCKLQLIAWLTKALGWIHKRNILHLDIKPANILLPDAHPEHIRVLEHRSGENGRTRAAPIVLIDFSSAVVCGTDYELGGEAERLSFAAKDARDSEKSGGGIQTTPQYSLVGKSKSCATYDWRADMYAMSLVSWQILLWFAPREDRWDAVRNVIKTSSQPLANTGFFSGSLLQEPEKLGEKMRNHRGTMAEFYSNVLTPDSLVRSMEDDITASKVLLL